MRLNNTMTELQWNECDNSILMLEFLFNIQSGRSDSARHQMGCCLSFDSDEQFEMTLHRFYVASCRRIWRLLPDKETRKGVEIAEKFLDGYIPYTELNDCDYFVEGAAFGIDYKSSPDELKRWISGVDDFPKSDLFLLLSIPNADRPDSYELLKSAAYFAHYAIMYPAINPKGVPPQSYHQFLSADLLRQHIQYRI